MRTQIIIHIFPEEIDWFEWQSKQFKIASDYLSSDDNITIDVTLDLNFVDWENSRLPKDFFIGKFDDIKNLWDWADTIFDIDESEKCRGCDDKRRNSIRNYEVDNFLYLDSDIIFQPKTLKYILNSARLIPDDYYIISPQTVRMWDSTWDVITNKNFLSIPANNKIYTEKNPFSILALEEEEIKLKAINTFKFGGGWFNLFSNNLLKLVDVPDSFGPYGVDDLYIMLCCNELKKKNYSVKQYILENIVVTENTKYKSNIYTKLLNTKDSKQNFLEEANSNLVNEVLNFINKI